MVLVWRLAWKLFKNIEYSFWEPRIGLGISNTSFTTTATTTATATTAAVAAAAASSILSVNPCSKETTCCASLCPSLSPSARYSIATQFIIGHFTGHQRLSTQSTSGC